MGSPILLIVIVLVIVIDSRGMLTLAHVDAVIKKAMSTKPFD